MTFKNEGNYGLGFFPRNNNPQQVDVDYLFTDVVQKIERLTESIQKLEPFQPQNSNFNAANQTLEKACQEIISIASDALEQKTPSSLSN